jgi:hypothetical protein
MLDTIVEREIITELAKLPTIQQRQVLQFAQFLVHQAPIGVPGKSLLRFAGVIDQADLAVMAQAIEEGCEQVNSDEW